MAFQLIHSISQNTQWLTVHTQDSMHFIMYYVISYNCTISASPLGLQLHPNQLWPEREDVWEQQHKKLHWMISLGTVSQEWLSIATVRLLLCWVFSPCRIFLHGVFPWSVWGQYRPKSVVTCDSSLAPGVIQLYRLLNYSFLQYTFFNANFLCNTSIVLLYHYIYSLYLLHNFGCIAIEHTGLMVKSIQHTHVHGRMPASRPLVARDSTAQCRTPSWLTCPATDSHHELSSCSTSCSKYGICYQVLVDEQP